MKRRGGIVAGFVALILVATATPALAVLHGRVCDTYYHAENHTAVEVCISTNQHNQTVQIQALVEFFNVDGWGHVTCLWLDKVQEYQNGAVWRTKQGLTGCAYGTGGFDENQEQTDWATCDDSKTYFAVSVDVKIKWEPGSSSTLKTDTSNTWNPPAGDCTF